DVRRKRGDVERAASAHDPGLRAHLVIPERLTLPGRVAAVCGQVTRRAERSEQRVVDSAEAEAFGDLRIEAGRVAQFIAGHRARYDAVGADRTDAVDRICKDAVEYLGAIFLVVVPAQAACQLEPVADRVGPFAEYP